jgi:ribosomal protein S18 acetylase RimI-like enzyme
MNIQPLLPHQAADYRALMLEAYTLHPEAFTTSLTERSALPLSWWQARLGDEPNAAELVLGAVDAQNKLAGVVGLRFESREKLRHKATLFGMYVPRRHRHQGVGQRLVQTALLHAASRPGVLLVQLTVTEGNRAAQALYERCGFEAYGVEPLAVAVNNGHVAKVHMWYRLPAARPARPTP